MLGRALDEARQRVRRRAHVELMSRERRKAVRDDILCGFGRHRQAPAGTGRRSVAQSASLHYGALAAQSAACPLRDWLRALPEHKRAAVERLRDPADRTATLLGVALLADVLRTRGRDLGAGDLVYPTHGRPRLPGGPEFSIAHGGGLVACAVADVPIGLDLEARGAARAEQLRLVLSAGERAAVDAGALDPTDAWVMKEAVSKAAGRGVTAMRDVTLRDGAAVLQGREWWLARVPLPATHVAWLAARERIDTLQVVAVTGATALPAAP
jgi:phosphopantetheinyl transferase